jgi:3-oxoacyl-(acyl-carrier-protein) synthase
MEVFGAHAPELHVSGTKSMYGHMLGATGAVEAVMTALTLHHRAIAPTAHLEEVDPACTGVHHVVGGPLRDEPLRAALSSAFAFGGSNAVLVFRAAE